MAFFGGVSSAIFILTVALFLSMEGNGAEKFLILITPKKYENQISLFFKTSQKKVAGWFGARILACAFVGIACFIVFYIFNVKYAFLLALISGILNFVPYIGPVLTVIVMLVFTAVSSESWAIVAYVLIAFFIIQSIENFLLTPINEKNDRFTASVSFDFFAGGSQAFRIFRHNIRSSCFWNCL
jgi:predicted PurR-regulated permease PerM